MQATSQDSTAHHYQGNVDAAEVAKFEALASRWWDPQGEFKPLHDINPLRLDFIDARSGLAGKKVLDVGCGQGACTWFMAKEGGQVTAFDGSPTGLQNVSEIAKEFGVTNKFNLVLGDITSPGKYISETSDILLDNYSLYSNPEE